MVTTIDSAHATIIATAPELSPKTWYGMPAYTNSDGKIVETVTAATQLL